MEKAYMIRNDGKLFPVVQHLYGNVDEVTETLFAGEWLYNATNNPETKKAVIDLVAAYAVFEEGLSSSKDLAKELCEIIESYPYKYLSKDFVNKHEAEIKAAFNRQLEHSNNTIKPLCEKVVKELNQEFMRARYGGLYNTNSSSKEMVFRISSTEFNWHPIIWDFVYTNRRVIDCVTIVRDEEATGVPNKFYIAKNGAEYNQMPVDDFIMEKGNPVIETSDLVREHLQAGKSLQSMYDLPMNRERIEYRYKCLLERENRKRSFWQQEFIEEK